MARPRREIPHLHGFRTRAHVRIFVSSARTYLVACRDIIPRLNWPFFSTRDSRAGLSSGEEYGGRRTPAFPYYIRRVIIDVTLIFARNNFGVVRSCFIPFVIFDRVRLHLDCRSHRTRREISFLRLYSFFLIKNRDAEV